MHADPLAKLHDIQIPEPITWWPLAWGWYLVIVALLLLTFVVTRGVLRAIKHRRAKRQALRLLQNAEQLASPMARVKQANEVLKRAVLAYEQRQEVAELSGERWAEWLNARGKTGSQIDAHLLSLAYRPDCEPEQAQHLVSQVRQWLNANLPLKPMSQEKARV